MRTMKGFAVVISGIVIHAAAQSTATNRVGCANFTCYPAQPAASFGSGTYSVGGDVSAPVLVHAVDPVLSEEARRTHYQGECILQVVIGPDGKVSKAMVSRPLGMRLDEKAVDAVKQYRYKPAMLHGRAVPVHMSVTVTFRNETASEAPSQPD